MKKGTFDLIFIAVATVVLLLIHFYVSSDKYMAFSLIPILAAYYLGQLSERKFGANVKAKSTKTSGVKA